MLDQLRFVQRGVARREIVPGLTHFRIVDGRCTGFNGAYAISAPVSIGFNVAPNASAFIKALDACEDVIQLTMDSPANLLVRSGNFRTAVPCVELESVPSAFPEGKMITSKAPILAALEALQPFIGIDASRPWATGVLFANQSAFATNNIIIAEYWMGATFPHLINVPSAIIDEVISVHEELLSFQIAENNITFHYADGRWIKSQILDLNWPNIPRVMEAAWDGVVMQPVDPELVKACDKLEKFGEKGFCQIYFRGTDIATNKDGAVNGGALVELPNLPSRGAYNARYLNSVLAVATEIDFERYPGPIPFVGGNLRGAFCGKIE